jgi:hypothetical protein
MPAVVDIADHIFSWNSNLLEKDLVEVRRTSHLSQWSYQDAGAPQVKNEGGYAHMLGNIRVAPT